MRGVKRYALHYKSDRTVCGSCDHDGGRASELRTILGYARKIKRELAAEDPRGFYVTDQHADDPMATRLYLDPNDDPRQCRICGCTAACACVTEGGPCCWIEEDLCSACGSLMAQEERHNRRATVHEDAASARLSRLFCGVDGRLRPKGGADEA
jgi:hypothetical protein